MSNTSSAIILIVIIASGYFFVYPSFQEVQLIQQEKSAHLASLEMMNNIESKKNQLLTEYDKISIEDRKNIDTVLPSSLNLVRLISQIDAVASKYGIAIDKISSRDNDMSSGGSIESGPSLKPFRSSIISFYFISTYENFKLLMNGLEKSLRIIDIKTVKLEVQEGGLNQYTVEFETYWLN
jgi:hypothetical protein